MCPVIPPKTIVVIILGKESTSGNRLFYIDLSPQDQSLNTLIEHVDSDTYLIDNQDEVFILYTNLDAPNGKVVSFDTH